MSERDVEALRRLDALTRRLRRECPWDREQDERSIVPHTVEEAYELAQAAHAGDDAKLLDELGDVLFQVTKIVPATQQSLAQATPTIRQTLAAQNQQTALDNFVKDWQKRWRAKTTCQDGYKTSDCSNGPKPTPTPSAQSVPGQ